MKRSEMLLDIASELVHEHTNFMPWSKAQQMAEIVLSRIEREGMKPPMAEVPPYQELDLPLDPNPKNVWAYQWEPEDSERDYCGAV
jgi:hypothetical protein